MSNLGWMIIRCTASVEWNAEFVLIRKLRVFMQASV